MDFLTHRSHSRLVVVFLCLFVLFCFASPIACQLSIPPRPDGFWYGGPTAESSVLIEAFFDPVCPDSRDSWPPLKKALELYGARTSLVVHTFPLPYHDHAFATSRALHIVNNLNSSLTYPLLEAFFKDQEEFYGRTTYNLSKAAVVDKIETFVTKIVGDKHGSDIKLGFKDTTTDKATRFAFKRGCLLGVYGTPFFFVNGFPLPDAGSAIDFHGWKKVIDPLVKQGKNFGELVHLL